MLKTIWFYLFISECIAERVSALPKLEEMDEKQLGSHEDVPVESPFVILRKQVT